MTDNDIIYGISVLCNLSNEIAKEKGWWEEERSDGELIALIHSELSEALEAFRNGNPQSEKIPKFNCVEEELADVLIRVADMCKARGFRLGEALVAKLRYNEGRSYKHGGKKF